MRLIIQILLVIEMMTTCLYGENTGYNISAGFQLPINIDILNSIEDDFAPYFDVTRNELIFNSMRNGTSMYYVSKLDKAGMFLTPQVIKSPLNEKGQQRAYFTLLDSRNALIGAYRHTDAGAYMNLQKIIYQRNMWLAPVPVAELSDTFFTSHPTISPNGEILVYSSNKYSKDGTLDLCYTARQADGGWAMEMPIDELNSIKNEITPYFVTDSLLLFASDGFEGEGGYDLYYSYFESGVWSKPYPIESVNTEYDETDPTMLSDGTLLFVSDRAGGKGGLDLYCAFPTIVEQVIEEQQIPYTVNGTSFMLDVNRKIGYDLTYDSIQVIDSSFETMPKFIQFKIEKKPNYVIKDKYKYRIECAGQVLENKEAETSFIVDFSKYGSEIYSADSLDLIVVLDEFEKIIKIEISKGEERELYLHQSGDVRYYRILTKCAEDYAQYRLKNAELLDKIMEISQYSTHISVTLPKECKDYQIFLKKEFLNRVITFEIGNGYNVEYKIYIR